MILQKLSEIKLWNSSSLSNIDRVVGEEEMRGEKCYKLRIDGTTNFDDEEVSCFHENYY